MDFVMDQLPKVSEISIQGHTDTTFTEIPQIHLPWRHLRRSASYICRNAPWTWQDWIGLRTWCKEHLVLQWGVSTNPESLEHPRALCSLYISLHVSFTLFPIPHIQLASSTCMPSLTSQGWMLHSHSSLITSFPSFPLVCNLRSCNFPVHVILYSMIIFYPRTSDVLPYNMLINRFDAATYLNNLLVYIYKLQYRE